MTRQRCSTRLGTLPLLLLALLAGSGIRLSAPALASAAPDMGRILFQADWSHGLRNWIGSADWSVHDGLLSNDGSAAGWSVLLAPYRPTTPNYAVEATIAVLSPGDSRGIVVHASQAGHLKVGTDRGYGAEIADQGNMPLVKTPYAPGVALHTYRVDVRGAIVTLSLDGRVMVQTTDPHTSFGHQLGLWDGGSSRLLVTSFRVLATGSAGPVAPTAQEQGFTQAPSTASGAGACTNDLLRQAITWIAQRPPRGTAETGECNEALYTLDDHSHITLRSSWDDIMYAVARHFFSYRYPRSLGVLMQHQQHKEQLRAAHLSLGQIAASCGGLPQQAAFAAYAEGRFVDLINADRRARGLPPLAVDHDLTVVSRIQSARALHEAVTHGVSLTCVAPMLYLQHTFSAAAQQEFYATHCYATDARLRTVARGFTASAQASHNLLSRAYTSIGVGVYMLPPSRPGWNLFVTITLGSPHAPGSQTTFVQNSW